MTTGELHTATLRSVTRAIIALMAAEAVYRVAIRSQLRRALGVSPGA